MTFSMRFISIEMVRRLVVNARVLYKALHWSALSHVTYSVSGLVLNRKANTFRCHLATCLLCVIVCASFVFLNFRFYPLVQYQLWINALINVDLWTKIEIHSDWLIASIYLSSSIRCYSSLSSIIPGCRVVSLCSRKYKRQIWFMITWKLNFKLNGVTDRFKEKSHYQSWESVHTAFRFIDVKRISNQFQPNRQNA